MIPVTPPAAHGVLGAPGPKFGVPGPCAALARRRALPHLEGHFDVASKVAFGGGGGAGKISCSLNFHPGSTNRPYIEFALLPASQAQEN